MNILNGKVIQKPQCENGVIFNINGAYIDRI